MLLVSTVLKHRTIIGDRRVPVAEQIGRESPGS